MKKSIRLMILLLPVLVIVACAPANPAQSIRTGAEIATYNFSESGTFEEGAYTGSQVALRIVDGVYRITIGTGDNELWWGQWGETLTNTVIDVDTEQTTERNENAYGIGCRMSGTMGQAVELDSSLLALASQSTDEPEAVATTLAEILEATAEATVETTQEATESATSEATADTIEEATVVAGATEEATTEAFEEGGVSQVPASRLSDIQIADGDGYLFLIQGSGSYAIMLSRNRSITPLVNWTPSATINQGVARNQLRAVCAGDYLAFYINGKFVADVRDTTYADGQVALLASAANRLGVRIEFDNLKVSEAEAM